VGHKTKKSRVVNEGRPRSSFRGVTKLAGSGSRALKSDRLDSTERTLSFAGKKKVRRSELQRYSNDKKQENKIGNNKGGTLKPG